MDPVDPLSRLVRALHASRLSHEKTAGGTASSADSTSRSKQSPASSMPPVALEQRLRLRWSALSERTPRRLSETLVETVLLHELGDQLANDPRFFSLTENVAQQILEDDQLADDIRSLAESMR
jgi:hypothetical protein